MSASKPHVFVITCHELGRHLGCYGVASVHLPHLYLLAAAGARFEHAFCTAPRSGQSGHRALPTEPWGAELHPWRLRLRSALGGTTRERHAAACSTACGYETLLFGLQHVTQSAVDGGDVGSSAGKADCLTALARYHLALQECPSTPRRSVGTTG